MSVGQVQPGLVPQHITHQTVPEQGKLGRLMDKVVNWFQNKTQPEAYMAKRFAEANSILRGLGADPKYGPDLANMAARTLNGAATTNRPWSSIIKGVVRDLDPTVPIFNTETMSDVVRASTARLSLALMLMSIAAAITLVLGTIGLYGVMAYMVALRTREFGVRVALGARPSDIARAVAIRGLMLVGIGAAAGFGADAVSTAAGAAREAVSAGEAVSATAGAGAEAAVSVTAPAFGFPAAAVSVLRSPPHAARDRISRITRF